MKRAMLRSKSYWNLLSCFKKIKWKSNWLFLRDTAYGNNAEQEKKIMFFFFSRKGWHAMLYASCGWNCGCFFVMVKLQQEIVLHLQEFWTSRCVHWVHLLAIKSLFNCFVTREVGCVVQQPKAGTDFACIFHYWPILLFAVAIFSP